MLKDKKYYRFRAIGVYIYKYEGQIYVDSAKCTENNDYLMPKKRHVDPQTTIRR